MGLFDMCCPKKPKKSLDYVIKWIEDADKTFSNINVSIAGINATISALQGDVKDLEDWKTTIESSIDDLVTEAIEDYDWSNLPTEALQAKADKVENATQDNLASLDAEGNLQDSGKKASDFAAKEHTHEGISNAGSTVNINENGNIRINPKSGAGAAIIFGSNVTEVTSENVVNLKRALRAPDEIPTQGSDKLITSGVVKNAILGVDNVDPKTLVGNSSITINTTDNSVRGLDSFEVRFPKQRFPYFIKLGLYDGVSTSYIDNAVLKYHKEGAAYKVNIYTAANIINITGTVTIVDDEEIITWGTSTFTNQADVDTIPTYGSSKLVTSGGVYNALQGINANSISEEGQGQSSSVTTEIGSLGGGPSVTIALAEALQSVSAEINMSNINNLVRALNTPYQGISGTEDNLVNGTYLLQVIGNTLNNNPSFSVSNSIYLFKDDGQGGTQDYIVTGNTTVITSLNNFILNNTPNKLHTYYVHFASNEISNTELILGYVRWMFFTNGADESFWKVFLYVGDKTFTTKCTVADVVQETDVENYAANWSNWTKTEIV